VVDWDWGGVQKYRRAITRRVVKVTCADFAGLIYIFHRVNQLWRRVKWL